MTGHVQDKEALMVRLGATRFPKGYTDDDRLILEND